MSGRSFVDTNVLLYAHNQADPARQSRARALLDELGESGRLVLSTQVVQEFYSVGSRKLALPRPFLRAAVTVLLTLPLVTVAPTHIALALEIEDRYQVSLWDALILATATAAGAQVLYTEDLNHGQRYGPVEVRNPFL